jgi:uncharacterized protein (UPF0276 family)
MTIKSPPFDSAIGVGYRPAFRDAFLSGAARASVGWIEVITENFLPLADGSDTRALQTLCALRRELPVALHGVGLNLASADALEPRYLAALAGLASRVEPFLVTDHLCWTGVNHENLFDLLPFPFTAAALEHVAEKISRVQELLKRPMAVENITYYAQPAGDEMPEEEFLNQLCARTGCQLLLDINNIYVNQVNLGVDPGRYLSRLRLENVAEVHLAGHFERADGLLIDTHGAPVKQEVWDLYASVLPRLKSARTMIERDQNIPEWEVMAAELARLRSIRAAAPAGRTIAHESSPEVRA